MFETLSTALLESRRSKLLVSINPFKKLPNWSTFRYPPALGAVGLRRNAALYVAKNDRLKVDDFSAAATREITAVGAIRNSASLRREPACTVSLQHELLHQKHNWEG